MPYSYKFDPIAAVEYEEVYLWYYERNIKAADGFQKAMEDAITSVCTNPFRYRNTYRDVREKLFKKYPYSLIYHINTSQKGIIILSVFHHKRNPANKYR